MATRDLWPADETPGLKTQLGEKWLPNSHQALEPEAHDAVEVALDEGEQTIVTEEMREKTLPASTT